jgi:hypothetical protein
VALIAYLAPILPLHAAPRLTATSSRIQNGAHADVAAAERAIDTGAAALRVQAKGQRPVVGEGIVRVARRAVPFGITNLKTTAPWRKSLGMIRAAVAKNTAGSCFIVQRMVSRPPSAQTMPISCIKP